MEEDLVGEAGARTPSIAQVDLAVRLAVDLGMDAALLRPVTKLGRVARRLECGHRIAGEAVAGRLAAETLEEPDRRQGRDTHG
jgi:hypothetical protein